MKNHCHLEFVFPTKNEGKNRLQCTVYGIYFLYSKTILIIFLIYESLPCQDSKICKLKGVKYKKNGLNINKEVLSLFP